MLDTQAKIGETVLLNFSFTGFCTVFDKMGLDLYTYFFVDYPEVLAEFMDVSVSCELRRIHAVADAELSPVILIPEDFSSKRGPIFSPDFCRRYHHEPVRKLTEAWHEHGVKVLFHSDGNYKAAIPDLLACGVDGFYCLEPNAGMDIVELKNAYPQVTWSGGIDGVDLMERGEPAAGPGRRRASHSRHPCAGEGRDVRGHLGRDQSAGQAGKLPRHGRGRRRLSQPALQPALFPRSAWEHALATLRVDGTYQHVQVRSLRRDAERPERAFPRGPWERG